MLRIANFSGVRSQGVKRGNWKMSEVVVAQAWRVDTAASKPARRAIFACLAEQSRPGTPFG